MRSSDHALHDERGTHSSELSSGSLKDGGRILVNLGEVLLGEAKAEVRAKALSELPALRLARGEPLRERSEADNGPGGGGEPGSEHDEGQ